MKSLILKVLLGLGGLVVAIAVAVMIYIRVYVEPSDRDENGKPTRAAGIPADHKWYGGLDGGTWIHCVPQKDYKEFRCSIYGESGLLDAKGVYVPSRAVVPPYEFISGSIGQIILKDQQEGLMVELKAEGWIEFSDGKSFYKNGEPVDAP